MNKEGRLTWGFHCAWGVKPRHEFSWATWTWEVWTPLSYRRDEHLASSPTWAGMSNRGKRSEWAHKLSESKNGAKTSWHQLLIEKITLGFPMCDVTTFLPQRSKFLRIQGTDGEIYSQVSIELWIRMEISDKWVGKLTKTWRENSWKPCVDVTKEERKMADWTWKMNMFNGTKNYQ